MTDGVLLVDEAGLVTSANSAAATILGRDAGRPRAGARCRRSCRRCASSDQGNEVEPPSPPSWCSGCAPSPVSASWSARSTAPSACWRCWRCPVGGESTATLIVLRDVTDRRNSEERTAQAEKLRALGQLASGVAHDVNNLLAAVLGRSELARLEVERGQIDPSRLLEALGQIEQAAEDGARTVRRIQEFARVRTDADVAVVDLAKLARDTIELTRPSWRDTAQAGGRPIAVEVDFEPDLLVAAEPLELREVLTNLILNAVDAMPRGGRLRVAGRRTGEMVQVNVSDTGHRDVQGGEPPRLRAVLHHQGRGRHRARAWPSATGSCGGAAAT